MDPFKRIFEEARREAMKEMTFPSVDNSFLAARHERVAIAKNNKLERSHTSSAARKSSHKKK